MSPIVAGATSGGGSVRVAPSCEQTDTDRYTVDVTKVKV